MHGFIKQKQNVLSTIRENKFVAFLESLIQKWNVDPLGCCRKPMVVVTEKLSKKRNGYELFAYYENKHNRMASFSPSCHKPCCMYHSRIDTLFKEDPENWHTSPFINVQILESMCLKAFSSHAKGMENL